MQLADVQFADVRAWKCSGDKREAFFKVFSFFFALESVSAYRKLSKLRAACFGQGHAKGLGSSPRDISLAIIKHLLTSVHL